MRTPHSRQHAAEIEGVRGWIVRCKEYETRPVSSIEIATKRLGWIISQGACHQDHTLVEVVYRDGRWCDVD